MSLSHCSHRKIYWHGKIYAGSHTVQSVYRGQSNEVIKCSDPRFSQGVWISDDDFKVLLDEIIESDKL